MLASAAPLSNLDPIFRPFRDGRLSLRNRVVMAPMTREFCRGGVPDDTLARYYARRAEGGVGTVITEGTGVSSVGLRNEYIPRFFGEDALQGWARVVVSVHEHKAAIMPQLWHVGIQQTDTVLNPEVTKGEKAMVGPSGLDGTGRAVAKPMTVREIEDTIRDFGDAAAAAQRIGFDGIELHGAHGYLIDQFLWEFTNRRSDGFGGSLSNRVRFAAAIVAECRSRTAPDFPIVFRWSQWKVYDYEAKLARTPHELEVLLAPLADAGVDVFDVSTRRFQDPGFEGSPLSLAGWTRKVTGKATMAVGSVGLDLDFMAEVRAATTGRADVQSLAAVSEALDREEFDLIALGRSLIPNADWVHKVRAGNTHQLRTFDKDQLKMLE